MRYEIDRNQFNAGRSLSANYTELLAARKVIKEMSGIGDIRLDDAGSYLAKIDELLPTARLREEQQITRAKNRREILKIFGISTTIIGGGFLVGLMFNRTFYSEEAIAKRAAEQKAKEAEERAKKEKFEAESVLGLTPSAQSVYNWRIYYPKYDQRVSYVAISKSAMDFQVNGGSNVELPGGGLDGRNTAINLTEYTRLDGVTVPSLDVTVRSATKASYSIVEKWLLRDQPATGIDTGVVAFESVRESYTFYLAISKSRPSSDIFRIQIMERIVK